VGSRGELDRNCEAKVGRLRDGFNGKKFRHRKSRQSQQVPRSARAIVVANNLDSHLFLRKKKCGTTDAHGFTRMKEKNRKEQKRIEGANSLPQFSIHTVLHPCLSVCIRG
jgi:hypothetical protein